MNTFELKDIITQITGQANTVAVPSVFKRWLGTYNHAVLLAQIIYWSGITNDADGWFWKSAKDWEEEIYLTASESKYSTDKLKSLDLIETKVKKIRGVPTKHYRIKWIVFNDLFPKFLKSLKTAKTQQNTVPNGNDTGDKSDLAQVTSPISSPNTTTKNKEEREQIENEPFVEVTPSGTRAVSLNPDQDNEIEKYLQPIRDYYDGSLANEFRWGNICVKAIDNHISVDELLSALKNLLKQNRKFPVTPDNVYQMALDNRAKAKARKNRPASTNKYVSDEARRAMEANRDAFYQITAMQQEQQQNAGN